MTAAEDRHARVSLLVVRADSAHTTHPSIPRPPQPCLGVKVKVNGSDTPGRDTTIVRGDCGRDRRLIMLASGLLDRDKTLNHRLTFSLLATSCERGWSDPPNSTAVISPNLRSRSSLWSP